MFQAETNQEVSRGEERKPEHSGIDSTSREGEGLADKRKQTVRPDPARMELSVTKGEGFTVLTLTSNPGSSSSILCQILKALCCGPSCAVTNGVRKLMDGTQSALATTQVMMGLFTIGFGAVLLSTYDGPYLLSEIYAPYWLGPIFIFSGICSIIAERFPSKCVVYFNAVVNLVSVLFAVTAFAFYLVDEGVWMIQERLCHDYTRQKTRYDDYDDYGYRRHPQINSTEVEGIIDHDLELCRMYKRLLRPMLLSLRGVLVAVAVLQFCANISVVVLGIRALKKGEASKEDADAQQPLMEEEAADPGP
ncbi:hypothetical protein AGOR_G00034520 [Albula goreensis]|uniref:Uncharacterized protein n=1 Tax=Albula goreensis TaxID=1534307 RepID=A0A8T3DZS6_9TELE|nr:hypothetical protein AGOR_G00034520 [Albula goreensis]